MPKYRNIPQATKDNVLHYINQVYDEAYELGYQHGKRQGESDIEKTQRMIEDAVESLKELTINHGRLIRCKDCKYWQDNNNGYPVADCRWGNDETPDADDYCSFAERRAEQ